MTNAEIEVIKEIGKYKKMILETNSPNRKWQLTRHLKKLRKDLIIYRFYRKRANVI